MSRIGKTLRLAVVQMPPVFLNVGASLDKACALIAQAGREGAQLTVFPETWLPGYPVWLDYARGAALWDHPPARTLYRVLWESCPALDGAAVASLRDSAVKARSHVVIGLQERTRGTLYNTLLCIEPSEGGVTVHRKLMPTYTERLLWGRGDGSTLNVSETGFGNLGGLICWEHWMPLLRAAMHAKLETVHVAQWPWVKEMNHVASRHYAFEGGCFVVAAGCTLSRADILEGVSSLADRTLAANELLDGLPDELLLRGGSAVIDPFGQYVSEPVYDRSGLLHTEIELGAIAEARLALDTDGHYARPDVFQLSVNEAPLASVEFQPRRTTPSD